MPYSSNSDLPAPVKNNLPTGVQTIYRKAFNSAHKQYKSEVRVAKISWGAVKKEYKKGKAGKWVRK